MKLLLFLICPLLLSCGSLSSQKTSKVFRKATLKIHGHRGSRGTHPENSLSAFAEALDAGVDFLELDVVLDKNGVPIVSHDSEIPVWRCSAKSGIEIEKGTWISELDLQDLEEIQCGGKGHPDFPNQKKIPSKLLTLREFLTWFKDASPFVKLNIETKMKGNPKPRADRFARNVVYLLKEFKLIDRAVLQSFDFSVLKEARRIDPQITISALFYRESSFCRPAKALKADIASPRFLYVTKDEVAKCHVLGIKVLPFTLNEVEEWESAIDMEVDGIISDYPRKLVKYWKKRNAN